VIEGERIGKTAYCNGVGKQLFLPYMMAMHVNALSNDKSPLNIEMSNLHWNDERESHVL
jgi:hypothetical protein